MILLFGGEGGENEILANDNDDEDKRWRQQLSTHSGAQYKKRQHPQ